MLNARRRIFLAFLVAGALVFPAGVGFFLPNAAKGQAQPALDFTVAPSTISERNGTATITVPITNGVVFATDQVICTELCRHGYPERLHG